MVRIVRIALLMGQDLSFSRAVIRGVREYALLRPHWTFRNGPPSPDIIPELKAWKSDGIIANLFDEEFARRLIRFRRPIVDTACAIPGLRVPVVDVDHEAVGRMAADHFLGRGFRNFGYFGIRGAAYSQMREESFCHRLAEEGHTASICYGDYIRQVPTIKSWKSLERETRRWLQELPKPAAIFACNDIPARTLADTCLLLGFKVPGDVALLGVDNDDLECSLTVPPLSSIEIPGERIGYEAAEMLDQMLNNGERPESVFLPPVGLVTRQSTDMTAVSDLAVSAALSFMRERATDGINVESVLLHVGITRRDLERRFRKLLHSSILQELRRIRVEHAKRLLAGTGLPMPAVARHSGFSSPQRLAVVFRQFERISPTEYRRQVRG